MVPDAVDVARLRRALVVKLRHHGDVLLAGPVFSVLKNHAPQLEIDALVYDDTQEMLTLHPAIAEVHTVGRAWRGLPLARKLAAEWGLLARLRARRYDLLVTLTEHPRGVSLARLLRPRYRVAPDQPGRGRFWRKSFTHLYRLPGNGRRHTVEVNLDALRRIGVYPGEAERQLTLVPGAEATSAITARLASLGIAEGGFVHVHPASRWRFKCWPADRTAALIDALDRDGHAVVITAAPSAPELELVRDDPRGMHERADRPVGQALAQGARGAHRARETLRGSGLRADAHRGGDGHAGGRAVRAERRHRVGAVARAEPRDHLRRPSLPSLRQRRLRRRQGERMPDDASGRPRPRGRARAARRPMRRAPALAAALARIAATATVVALAHPAAAEIRVTDDRGREIVLARPATRIVTLAPHLTEIAFAAGAGGGVVGVSSYSDFPPEAMRLPVVSDHGRVNFEEIAKLKPDLALTWVSGNRAPDFERLEARGVRVFATEASRPEDVARILRLVGKLAGTEGEADAAARAVEARFASLRDRYRGRPAVRVFYEIWPEPLMTVNGRHLISHLVEMCGGRNVFAAAAPLVPTISREQVLAADPDAIVVAAPAPRVAERIAFWRSWERLRAGREGRVYPVDPAAAHRMSPRIVDGGVELCETLERARG